MKVKLSVCREIEIEVNDPVVAELDKFWRTNPEKYWGQADDMAEKAIKAVEKVSGLPFGAEAGQGETITAVYAMDGEAILEA